jgi:multiple sugar transport system ATP-binding protein
VVLGIRPEDIAIVDAGSGQVTGPVYSFELTGDAVLATIEVGETRLCARGDRRLRAEMGDELRFRLDPAFCHLFDGATGERLDARA